MKSRVIRGAVARVPLLVAGLSVACGVEPLAPGADLDVIGVLEFVEVFPESSTIDAKLLVGEMVDPTWNVGRRCEPACGKLVLLIRNLDETPIFVSEPGRFMRRGGLNDIAIGDITRGWPMSGCLLTLPPQCPATRIEIVKIRSPASFGLPAR